MLPIVSVLVLNHNSQEHLEPCFRSLLASDYPADRLELVLVDNASTDGSVEFVNGHFPTVRIIQHEQNWGFSRGYNLAVARIEADIVVLLNNDTRMAAEGLKELVKPFADDGEIAAVGARMLSWDGKRLDFTHAEMNFYGYPYQIGYGSRDVDTYNQARPLPFVCGGAMAVRRGVFLDAGGFDEDFFACYEDVDLCWRLWVLGHKVWFAPDAVVYHWHPGFWGAVADAKRRVLYERNALLSVIKNYEKENLQRVLPVALLLLLKRAYLLSGVDPDDYHVAQSAGPGSSAASTQAKRSLSHYSRQAVRLVRQRGWRGLWANVKVRRHRARSRGDTEEVPQQTISSLLAAVDVVALLPRIMEKRRHIQSRRRRPDAEILPLFKSLFDASYADPEYEATQEELAHLFGLNERFEQWTGGAVR